MDSLGARSAGELTRLREAERLATPFLVYRDEADEQQIVGLGRTVRRLVAGRGERCDLLIDWDPQVSRTHAHLECAGDEWTVLDDGLSRNGTFVNEERISTRHRLRDKDVLRLGRTRVLYRIRRAVSWRAPRPTPRPSSSAPYRRPGAACFLPFVGQRCNPGWARRSPPTRTSPRSST